MSAAATPLYEHTPHVPGDARHVSRRDYKNVIEPLSVQPPPALLIVGAEQTVALQLQSYKDTALCPSRRARCTTLQFILQARSQTLARRLETHPKAGIPVILEGPELLRRLALSAHEPAENAHHFNTAFLHSVHMRGLMVSGVDKRAGPCAVQLLAKDCRFNTERGKIEKARKTAPWTAYLRNGLHTVVRTLGAGDPTKKKNTAVNNHYSCAVLGFPGIHEKYGPQQCPLYTANVDVTARALHHLDAGALGLANFIVYKDGAMFWRCPEKLHPTGVRVCRDSLAWFMCHVYKELHRPEAYVKKLDTAQPCRTRRHEIHRLSLSKDVAFVPRSHLQQFDTVAVKGEAKAQTIDEENVSLVPTTPVEFDAACAMYKHDVFDYWRGVVDFTRGLRVVFEPLDPQAWVKHLGTDEFVTLSVTLDVVYVPLLGWLDTVPVVVSVQGAGDEDTDEEEAKVDEEEEEDSEDDDDATVEVGAIQSAP